MDDRFLKDILNISHGLKRRKLLRRLEDLKSSNATNTKEKSLDELDEYVMFLETHRLKVRYK